MSTPADAPLAGRSRVLRRIEKLPCWTGPVRVAPLAGGMTNRNYRVQCGAQVFAVRLGQDLPAHGVMRFNERAAARAAHAAGLSPEVVYAARGVMVSRFIPGRTLAPHDLRDPGRLPAVLELLRRCHHGIPAQLRGPALMFWVFQVLRSYHALLEAQPAHLLQGHLPRFAAMAARLEQDVGPVHIAFCHNDLLAANFLDDGHRLWLIDWDYAGFNSPLFDLANLAVNNGLSADQSQNLLEQYFGERPDGARRRAFEALACASLLRETLWGAVSHATSAIRFDFAAYTRTWLERLDQRWLDYQCGSRRA